MKRTNLIQARKDKGMTQKDVISLLDGYGSPGSMSNWEKKKSDPPLKVAAKIAKILGSPIEYLFEDLFV